MFHVKLCGITTVDDALAAARAGADAVGLNFYDKSRRYVSPDVAKEIAAVLPEGICRVGLFVNAPVQMITELFDSVPLDLIQLHGDEPPEYIAGLGHRPVMRAMRLGPDGLAPIDDYLRRCAKLDCVPDYLLLDAYVKGQYGGTGQTADWTTAARYVSEHQPATDDWYPPLVLAGGLTPENVGAAIRTVKPEAVDTAGGVESSPGRKDEELCRRFCEEAKAAFGAV